MDLIDELPMILLFTNIAWGVIVVIIAIIMVALWMNAEEGKKKQAMIEVEKEVKEAAAFARIKRITGKYEDSDIAAKILLNEYWLGMTEEMLVDAKGTPTNIEREVLKTKTKITYIYGTKSTGDYFVFENGVLIKFVDR